MQSLLYFEQILHCAKQVILCKLYKFCLLYLEKPFGLCKACCTKQTLLCKACANVQSLLSKYCCCLHCEVLIS